MKDVQSGLSARKAKKLNKQEKLILDDQIRLLLTNPSAGEEKKGDLKGIHVHQFNLGTIQYLIAYSYSDDVLELIMLGPHENYYRDSP